MRLDYSSENFAGNAVGADCVRTIMSRRVLVVDDDALVLEVVASMLEELGCETLLARSGTEALRTIVKDQNIEILISDVDLPGLKGTELAEQARNFRPELRVLLLSGRETNSRGFPLLRKPFAEPDLRRVMAETTGLC
jgi:two-component system, cell cycle response regulator CpdR